MQHPRDLFRSPKLRRLGSAALPMAALFYTGSAWAADFYVDPATGSPTGSGTAQSPWQTLERVVQDGRFGSTIHAGDTVWLRSGYHGEFVINSGSYATPITIAAAAGQTPRLRRASFSNTSGWVLRGVSISPSHAPTYAKTNIVQISGSASNVLVENCQVFSVDNASSWTAAQWVNDASNGFEVGGNRATVRNNVVRNVRFGISLSGDDGMIDSNQVINFSADGLRGLGDNGTFQYNVVKNSYVGDSQDANHDDGFQSWSVGTDGMVGTGEVRNVTLRGNLIMNFDNPSQPMQGTLQGIGCFDGFFVGWVVENNVVITNHWHGISFYGMRDSRIVNNTVIDNNNATPGPPWIMVTPHKNGTPSQNVLIRNNLATDYDLSGTAIVQDHNTTLTNNLAQFFVSPANFDLHLLANAPAVDTGSPDQAPPLDRDRVARPQGKGVDLGAYEWHTAAAGAAGTSGSGGGSGTGGVAGSSGSAGRAGASGSGQGGAAGASGSGSSGASGSGQGGAAGASGSGGGGASGSAGASGSGQGGGASGSAGASGSGNGGAGGSGTVGSGTGGSGTPDGGVGAGGRGGTGTAGARGGGTRGSGGANGAQDSGDDGGCACGVVEGKSSRVAWLLAAGALLLLRRRARTNSV